MIGLRFLKELICDICHYCYFLNKVFKFQSNVCNGCDDLVMMSMNLSNIAILNIKRADYRCIISGISKSEAMNLLQYLFDQKRWNIMKQNFIVTCKNG